LQLVRYLQFKGILVDTCSLNLVNVLMNCFTIICSCIIIIGNCSVVSSYSGSDHRFYVVHWYGELWCLNATLDSCIIFRYTDHGQAISARNIIIILVDHYSINICTWRQFNLALECLLISHHHCHVIHKSSVVRNLLLTISCMDLVLVLVGFCLGVGLYYPRLFV
jgi:hypothetical protein